VKKSGLDKVSESWPFFVGGRETLAFSIFFGGATPLQQEERGKKAREGTGGGWQKAGNRGAENRGAENRDKGRQGRRFVARLLAGLLVTVGRDG